MIFLSYSQSYRRDDYRSMEPGWRILYIPSDANDFYLKHKQNLSSTEKLYCLESLSRVMDTQSTIALHSWGRDIRNAVLRGWPTGPRNNYPDNSIMRPHI